MKLRGWRGFILSILALTAFTLISVKIGANVDFLSLGIGIGFVLGMREAASAVKSVGYQKYNGKNETK